MLSIAQSGSVPFSERTMLRILSECSTSVRKSLQGLVYIAAEGTRAFDALSELINQTAKQLLLGTQGQFYKRLRKAGKLYLKGNYKVIQM